MKSLKLTKLHTLGTVFAVIAVATLVMAVASAGNTALLEELPGKSMDTFSCSQICGGGEGCAADGPQCQGTVGDQACATTTVPYKAGYKCSSPGAACGSGTCTGGNDYVCDGSGNPCWLGQSVYCCTATVDSCATHGSGTPQNPYSCLCDGSGKDVKVYNRVGCTPG